ncbi:MAG: RecQ family ATP-dependent DNA helicase [Cyclobacteriaceae bacterium]|nr:RecQ family ATP-dependent DNA helicase [Cyclobacteriaceae bacterium]
MSSIAFIDTEIDASGKSILDIGGVRDSGSIFHSNSIAGFTEFLSGADFIGGHNILNHDVKYIGGLLERLGIQEGNIVDTLFLSPLFFPAKPYHALIKDDKIAPDSLNNPLNDSIAARELFFAEKDAFESLDEALKTIFYRLLADNREFGAFFRFIGFKPIEENALSLIRRRFKSEVCESANMEQLIAETPIELAYSLALINCHDHYSITPRWVLKNYPNVERVMYLLRGNPCLSGCSYCNQAYDIHKGLKKYFGFDSYRTYAGEALQEKAVTAALSNKSILAVFPTGGGKSITFQVPALMSGANRRGLTVVISPLQALMKDQVDNLERKHSITDAVTINGLLDPIERKRSIDRVEDGSASILYISPESLRSRTIERALLGRNVVRFVIDEAHCFSSWGQSFRVDYLYIGDFIKSFQDKKQLTEGIPVSCFTATAKQKVIEDIKEYFFAKLNLKLEVYTSSGSRDNLHFKVLAIEKEADKYAATKRLLEEKQCPSIIYVSRTGKAKKLADKLTNDGFPAKPYHGKMEVSDKTANQEAFMNGKVSTMVATSAFGMGVDKKDIGLIIHYDISDSLESYVQEAGRAGRDEHIQADCYVLFAEEDLDKHFILLNQTRITKDEIQQVWGAIKGLTGFNKKNLKQSALEIARKAGWDDRISEIETRVTTAIAALEDAGYIARGQNMPRVYANSIKSANAQEAIEVINASERFNPKDKENATRIIKKLISSKRRKQSVDDEAESRIDYIADHLGIRKEEVIGIVNKLREERILADGKDLTAFIRRRESRNQPLNLLEVYVRLERFLLSIVEEQPKTLNVKQLNQDAELSNCQEVTPARITTIFNIWSIKNWIKRQNMKDSRNYVKVVSLLPIESLKLKLDKRAELAKFILTVLLEKCDHLQVDRESEEVQVEFSVLEMKEEFERRPKLFEISSSVEDMEDALFYLSRIEAIKIEGGFMVLYNQLTIDRLEVDNRRRYKDQEYSKLERFYKSRVQQIHIVGEYAKRMITDYRSALTFVEDYFSLNYSSFLGKYFKDTRGVDIERNISPSKYRRLFGDLSPEQLAIVTEKKAKYMVVAAGPGSGKTRVLVHKLASVLLMEEVKHEQLLMLTFSRAAATEFKIRLIELIGNAANSVEIRTFHSFAFDILGMVGSLGNAEVVVSLATKKIIDGEIEPSRIAKLVLVIDEAQDMTEHEFGLIEALMKKNEGMRVIAVGDDDQCIFQWRGASAKYLHQLIRAYGAKKYELALNYRSKRNIVQFTNQWVLRINDRLKTRPIEARYTDYGKLRIFRHEVGSMIVPLVDDIEQSELVGTTCVIARTNAETLEIWGLLLHRGIPARLIQSYNWLRLYDLVEVRFFLSCLGDEQRSVISDDIWVSAKKALNREFARSTKLSVCNAMIKEFELSNPKRRYWSDLEIFIEESRVDDFVPASADIILVSTIHKAKGKEFDNVFLMLKGGSPAKDEDYRQLYVAMTRAKTSLTIHLDQGYLDDINVEGIERLVDQNYYKAPDQIVVQLSMRDVWLDGFARMQMDISKLIPGDTLFYRENGLCDTKGHQVLFFSSQFTARLTELAKQDYIPVSAKVDFVVYWKGESLSSEIKIVLPEITFGKRSSFVDKR